MILVDIYRNIYRSVTGHNTPGETSENIAILEREDEIRDALDAVSDCRAAIADAHRDRVDALRDGNERAAKEMTVYIERELQPALGDAERWRDMCLDKMRKRA